MIVDYKKSQKTKIVKSPTVKTPRRTDKIDISVDYLDFVQDKQNCIELKIRCNNLKLAHYIHFNHTDNEKRKIINFIKKSSFWK